MGTKLREWFGLVKQSKAARDFIDLGNMRSVVYMTIIVIALEVWMLISLALRVSQDAAAGKPRSVMWIINHGAWYVVLLAIAIVLLLHALQYLRGNREHATRAKVLLGIFSVVCLAFGIHFGNNSYLQGEQVLAFVTMTLFVFGMLVWSPLVALVGSVVTFGGFYLYINSGLPATYGTQVNLFTLWISTFVVSLAAYSQRISESNKNEKIKQASARLRKIADFDELTGIPNMHTFNGATLANFEGSKALGTHFSILFLDIEHFGSYNDKYGVLEGNELLRKFATGLTKVFENELVARGSEDHFMAMCETAVIEERVESARTLLNELRRDIRLHLKVGAYEPSEESFDVSVAIDKARAACSTIKRHPGKSLAYYDGTLDTHVRRRQYVINNVKKAVSEGWIKVFYQPVVRCDTGKGELCGYEALARWDDPTYGLLPPFVFIETLEEYREIDKLDRCIVEQVCRDLRTELDANKPVVPVSLNFSRLDFELYDVPAFLAKMTEKYQIPSNLLDVEITESALSDQNTNLQEYMSTLRENDFSLWLDDFGSGYSSLNVLKDFRFDVLKIDMVFLRGFSDNKKSHSILQSIVALAKELGMVTLCEGVETIEQYEFLHSIGCDMAQGYHFGKPQPTKEAPTELPAR